MKCCDYQIKQGRNLRVTYFKTRKQFLAFSRTKKCYKTGVTITGKNAAAQYLGYTSKNPDNKDFAGEILLYAEQYNADCVSHEVVHFVQDQFKDFGLSIGSDEELFAKLVGELTKDILGWKAIADEHPGKRFDVWDSGYVIDFKSEVNTDAGNS